LEKILDGNLYKKARDNNELSLGTAPAK
jgi:hypothetical protein